MSYAPIHIPGLDENQAHYDAMTPDKGTGWSLCEAIEADNSLLRAAKSKPIKVQDVELLAEPIVDGETLLDMSLRIRVESKSQNTRDAILDLLSSCEEYIARARKELSP